jgi:hypothetical protein
MVLAIQPLSTPRRLIGFNGDVDKLRGSGAEWTLDRHVAAERLDPVDQSILSPYQRQLRRFLRLE